MFRTTSHAAATTATTTTCPEAPVVDRDVRGMQRHQRLGRALDCGVLDEGKPLRLAHTHALSSTAAALLLWAWVWVVCAWGVVPGDADMGDGATPTEHGADHLHFPAVVRKALAVHRSGWDRVTQRRAQWGG